jgi:hypothetical protein
MMLYEYYAAFFQNWQRNAMQIRPIAVSMIVHVSVRLLRNGEGIFIKFDTVDPL